MEDRGHFRLVDQGKIVEDRGHFRLVDGIGVEDRGG